jgi:predicted DNA-binding transcriptional regulator AlpA
VQSAPISPRARRAAVNDEEPTISLRQALVVLAEVLPKLVNAVDRLSDGHGRVEPMAYRIDQVAECLGVSRSTIDRARKEGGFPPPDASIGGKVLLWRPTTIDDFLSSGGFR